MYTFRILRHMTKWRGCTTRAAVLRKYSTARPRPLSEQGLCLRKRATVLNHFGQRPSLRTRSYTTEVFKTFADENPILLRDTCQCAKCVDGSTHQREFRYADIPTNISVESIDTDTQTGTWKVRWSNDVPGYDDHVSIFPQSSLIQLLDDIPTSLDVHRTVSVWDKNIFTRETKDIDYQQLLKDERILAAALELLQRHGLVFVVNIPEEEHAVMKMVTRLTGLYRNTFYGQSWDVQSIPQAKNVAYTSKYLGFHMDLLYMKEPPGLQLLHCLQNSCQGGESEFADTFKAIDTLRQEQPKHVDRLVKSKIRYGYSNDGHFYSDDKPVIKVGNAKHVPKARMLHVADPDFMETVDCTFWSPPFINTIAHAAHDGDTKAFIEASKAFAEVMQRPELIYETKLPAGTCAVFDNLRVVHARKAFDMNSGKRWLKGIYGDRQDVLSKSLKHVWAR